jgi:hypothetical protein
LLDNPSFEGDWTRETHTGVEFGEIYTPRHWTWWWKEGEGFRRPECKVINREPPFLDPPRISDGNRAVLAFTMFGRMHAGLYQEIDGLEPGRTYRFSAKAHTWSAHTGVLEADGPNCSAGVGCGPAYIPEDEIPAENGDPLNDAIGNFLFNVGVQLSGEPDPFSDDVVWEPGAAIYNGHHKVPAVEFEAPEDGRVTVYLKALSRYAFQTSDVYWDAARLEIVGGEDEEQPYPTVGQGTRIGVHAIFANNVRGFAQELAEAGAKFSLVKAVDDMGWIEEIKAISPETITVGRFTSGIEGCGDVMSGDLAQMAEDLIDVILRKKGDTRCDYWEVVNEPDPPGPEGYRRLALLMIECMQLAEQHGLKLALFSLNAGTPEWDEMQAMVETGVFGRARAGGHVLALHEGTFDTYDPHQYWPDTIPGSPEVEGAGPLHFRYRFLYHLLEQRGEVIPLVISEWYLGDEQSASTETLLSALLWYDDEAARDYYLLGICPFTLGPSSGWSHTDWERVYAGGLLDAIVERKDRENALPSTDEESFDFKRTYILLFDDAGPDWFAAAAIGAHKKRRTIGYAAPDGGIGDLSDKTVVAVNPDQIGTGLDQSWYDEYYPGTKMEVVEAATPVELVIFLQDELEGDVAVAQQDAEWRDKALGEEPQKGTIGQYGCFLSGFTTAVRSATGLDVQPPLIDRIFVVMRTAYISGNLMDWDEIIEMVPSIFTDPIKDSKRRSAAEYAELLDQGYEVILRYADREHFVYLDSVQDDELHIIDTWDGQRMVVSPPDFAGVRAARKVGAENPNDPPEPVEVLRGLHDAAGGEYMAEVGMQGVCLAHGTVQHTPRHFDFRHLRDAGIDVLCRLNYGYANGTGTVPIPRNAERWIDAMARTINASQGVWGWIIANELNNVAEWPGGYPNPTFMPVASYYTDLYNEIASVTEARLSPTPIDPYNVVAQEYGLPGDPRTWAQLIYDAVDQVDFISLHAKTQENDPDQCFSEATFSHPPLLGRRLHLRTVEDQLEWVPEELADRPVFVTELNPQRRTADELGWEPDNIEWISKAIRYFEEEQPVDGVVFYRYDIAGDQAGFGLKDKPHLLDAVLNC